MVNRATLVAVFVVACAGLTVVGQTPARKSVARRGYSR